MYQCPKCKSYNIRQELTSTGKMWCDKCKFSINNKEDLLENPFITDLTDKSIKSYKDIYNNPESKQELNMVRPRLETY